MKTAASRRSPEMNCGPTFIPTENMNRLKKMVLANSGMLNDTPLRAAMRLMTSAAISVEAVAPTPTPLTLRRPRP